MPEPVDDLVLGAALVVSDPAVAGWVVRPGMVVAATVVLTESAVDLAAVGVECPVALVGGPGLVDAVGLVVAAGPVGAVGAITGGMMAVLVGVTVVVDGEIRCEEGKITGRGPRTASGLMDGRPIATNAPINSRTATAAATARAGPRGPAPAPPAPVPPAPAPPAPELPNTLLPRTFGLLGGQPWTHGSVGGRTNDPARAS